MLKRLFSWLSSFFGLVLSLLTFSSHDINTLPGESGDTPGGTEGSGLTLEFYEFQICLAQIFLKQGRLDQVKRILEYIEKEVVPNIRQDQRGTEKYNKLAQDETKLREDLEFEWTNI